MYMYSLKRNTNKFLNFLKEEKREVVVKVVVEVVVEVVVRRKVIA